MVNPSCLRCEDRELESRSGSAGEVEFFRCPSCCREFARKTGRALTYRWLHPVSLPLYCILLDRDPMFRVGEVATMFGKQRSAVELSSMLDEIELELEEPTQEVRLILDNPQSEDLCREFLREFVRRLRDTH